MPYDFGDVVLVKFPFTNQITFKQRPAVIVSSLQYNLERPDVVIAAVTSQIHSFATFGEVRITRWELANLLKMSAIKPVFATVEQTLIIRKLGVLDRADELSLREMIGSVLK